MSPEVVRHIVQGMIVLILSIAVHEYGHAFVADKLGDRLPRSQGRVTLNPIAHADPIGTLLFPMLGFVFSGGAGAGFGWGKPVMVNPVSFDRRLRMRTAHMLVAFAGPAMNVLLGTLLALVLAGLVAGGVVDLSHPVAAALRYAVFLNFILFFFNLIPAHPLDGGTVIEGFLPDSALPAWRQFAVYGPFVLMAVIFIPRASQIFLVPARWVSQSLLGLLGAV